MLSNYAYASKEQNTKNTCFKKTIVIFIRTLQMEGRFKHTDQTECYACPIRRMITDNHIRTWRSCEGDAIEHNGRYGYPECSAKLPKDDPINVTCVPSLNITINTYLGHCGKQSSCHTLFVRQGELGNE
jgi:hypothetical protein